MYMVYKTNMARSFFDRAVITNEKDMVKYLLGKEEGGIDVDENLHQDHYRDTFPLLVACQHGNEDMAKLFLDYRANVNKQNSTRTSALMVACQLGDKKVVQLLLEHSADADLEDETGHTALMFASFNGHHEIVELLLQVSDTGANKMKASISINKTNKSGMTALMLAVYEGHSEVVEMFCKKVNPQLNGRLVLDVSVLDIAKAKGHSDLCGKLSPMLDRPFNNTPCSDFMQPEELAHVLDVIVHDTKRNDVHFRTRYDQDDPAYPSLSTTFRLFSRVCKHWQNIALLFNVSDEVIQSIKYRSGESCGDQHCLRKILCACFSKARPTWKTLKEVVISLECKERESIIHELHQAMPRKDDQSTVKDPLHSSNDSEDVNMKLDLGNVYKIAYPLASEYPDLGLFLHVDMDQISIIERNNPNRCQDRLIGVLKKWLNSGNATWKDFLKAIELLNPRLAIKHAKILKVNLEE